MENGVRAGSSTVVVLSAGQCALLCSALKAAVRIAITALWRGRPDHLPDDGTGWPPHYTSGNYRYFESTVEEIKRAEAMLDLLREERSFEWRGISWAPVADNGGTLSWNPEAAELLAQMVTRTLAFVRTVDSDDPIIKAGTALGESILGQLGLGVGEEPHTRKKHDH